MEYGQSLDLGGHELVVLDAPIRDLPSTTWVYEQAEPTHRAVLREAWGNHS